MRRLRIVPRWAGHPESDFYPWLTRALLEGEERSPYRDVRALAMPDPNLPTIDAWVGRLSAELERDLGAAQETVLVGHSVGCQALLRYLASLPQGVTFRGALLVAGWLSIDTPWDSIRPWIETSFDLARARERVSDLVVLLSDNDPFTADYQENKRAWEERAAARVVVAPGAKHFNAAEEPAVLDILLNSFQ
ncbi:MAG: alpha/beta hydrolase [Polyangiaceae bacterium]|nr:alpha/beta hydrolase [Polyangiaceae bacterium]NUQ78272.1 alpha/beta hydrolase [Polyangiaceae bacterium]